MKHLVIIMADQLRSDFAGADTPNIDRLKTEGANFTNAFCSSPLCIPTRGSFFTGLYPNETGCTINAFGTEDLDYGFVKSGIPNLYSWLESSYDVWHVGKNHFWTQDHIEKKKGQIHWTYMQPDYRAFLQKSGKKMPGGPAYKGIVPQMYGDRTTHLEQFSIPQTGVFPEEFRYYYDGYFLEGALNAIRSRDKTKPLFLSAMFLAPHPPFQIPEPWFSMYKNDTCEPPDNVGVWYKDQSPLQLYNLPGIIGSKYGRNDWKEIWKVYKGAVSMLDFCAGAIIRELKQEGIYDDTVLLFTSDHGEMLGSHGLWQKMCMYQEAVKTPLYIKAPEYPPSIIDEYVSTIDIFPTICNLLDIPSPADISGTSCTELMAGNKEHRDTVFIQFDGNGGIGNTQRCIIRKGKKLIADCFKNEIYLEFYDIEQDPQERYNLAFEQGYHNLIKENIELLRQHMRESGDRIEIPDNLLEQFLECYQTKRLPEHIQIITKKQF